MAFTESMSVFSATFHQENTKFYEQNLLKMTGVRYLQLLKSIQHQLSISRDMLCVIVNDYSSFFERR